MFFLCCRFSPSRPHSNPTCLVVSCIICSLLRFLCAVISASKTHIYVHISWVMYIQWFHDSICILWIIICGCNHIDVKMCLFMPYYKSFNAVTWCGAKFLCCLNYKPVILNMRSARPQQIFNNHPILTHF